MGAKHVAESAPRAAAESELGRIADYDRPAGRPAVYDLEGHDSPLF